MAKKFDPSASDAPRTLTYNSWRSMIERCTNPNCHAYPAYGGRNLKVCSRWQEPDGKGFENFVADVGLRPGGKYDFSLDRVNTWGHYTPDNVRWADKKTQQRNKCNNKIVEWRGKEWVMAELAEAHGHARGELINQRLALRWTLDEAILTPSDGNYADYGPMRIDHDGCELTLDEWATKRGTTEDVLRDRFLQGWNWVQTLDTPIGWTTPIEYQRPKPHSPNKRILTGKLFGANLVLSELPRKGASPNARWLCYCDPDEGGCGDMNSCLSHNLLKGRSNSCGCLYTKRPRSQETIDKFVAALAKNNRYLPLIPFIDVT